MALGPRPPLYIYFRANEREKLPKPGQNSDFGPNPDISQSFGRCMRVVVHPGASAMSQTQVLASPSTRLAWFGLILFTRGTNRNLEWCHFGFPTGDYNRIATVTRCGQKLRIFLLDLLENVLVWSNML